MCGIAGFIGEGERPVLHRMIDVLAHRGPDGEGTWIDQNSRLFLGHRRLSIVDLAAGSQPMTTLDEQLVITFNGEIYNHVELRRKLEALGHRFKTDHSDTEVLLYGYREWGPAMLEKLNGMWSFAIYDRVKGELFLSRDRFGKKPLFYYSDDRSFVFASELTSLRLHPAVPQNVDLQALQKLFAYGFIPAPWSLLARVKKLPAGHWIKVGIQDLRCEIRKYWEFELDPFQTIHPIQSASGEKSLSTGWMRQSDAGWKRMSRWAFFSVAGSIRRPSRPWPPGIIPSLKPSASVLRKNHSMNASLLASAPKPPRPLTMRISFRRNVLSNGR